MFRKLMDRWFEARCTSGGNLHNFEPRYTEVPIVGNISSSGLVDMDKLRELMVNKQYVCDVCTWCGEIRDPYVRSGSILAEEIKEKQC